MMARPIFRSTGQCLHVAFLMEVLPATTRGFMQVILESHVQVCDEPDGSAAQRRGVDFGGMSALEVRGQCAMVRGLVEHHLPRPEACAVKAHYGHTASKAEGVRGLSDYVSVLLRTTDQDAVLALAWGVFGTLRQREGLSLRAVALHFGLTKSTAQRDQQTIKRMGRDMLSRAMDQLSTRLQDAGLVEDAQG
ncbi:hypothetical protein [Verminephrobacter aporrectodeae]|nr:hypothetical protein [Verminephrobacter aporrectodeae]